MEMASNGHLEKKIGQRLSLAQYLEKTQKRKVHGHNMFVRFPETMQWTETCSTNASCLILHSLWTYMSTGSSPDRVQKRLGVQVKIYVHYCRKAVFDDDLTDHTEGIHELKAMCQCVSEYMKNGERTF